MDLIADIADRLGVIGRSLPLGRGCGDGLRLEALGFQAVDAARKRLDFFKNGLDARLAGVGCRTRLAAGSEAVDLLRKGADIVDERLQGHRPALGRLNDGLLSARDLHLDLVKIAASGGIACIEACGARRHERKDRRRNEQGQSFEWFHGIARFKAEKPRPSS